MERRNRERGRADFRPAPSPVSRSVHWKSHPRGPEPRILGEKGIFVLLEERLPAPLVRPLPGPSSLRCGSVRDAPSSRPAGRPGNPEFRNPMKTPSMKADPEGKTTVSPRATAPWTPAGVPPSGPSSFASVAIGVKVDRLSRAGRSSTVSVPPPLFRGVSGPVPVPPSPERRLSAASREMSGGSAPEFARGIVPDPRRSSH